MRSTRYRRSKQKAEEIVSTSTCLDQIARTHNLELQRDDPEIENLHRRPEHEIRLQRW